MKEKLPKKAVALKYDPLKNAAPQVVAKGAGDIAEKIIKTAEENQVNIHEDKALVQMLYQLDLNEQIPIELYPIIAEIFALVYKAELIARNKND